MQDEEITMAEGIKTLPPWRCAEIVLKVVETLEKVKLTGLYGNVLLLARELGITVRPYSSFSAEHRVQLQKINLSYWKDGLCFFAPNGALSEACIFYDDSASAQEIQSIIAHELGHIMLRHTQQSQNAELEAFFFSGILLGIMLVAGMLGLEAKLTDTIRQTNNIRKVLHSFLSYKEVKAV